MLLFLLFKLYFLFTLQENFIRSTHYFIIFGFIFVVLIFIYFLFLKRHYIK